MLLRSQGTASRAVDTKKATRDKENLHVKPSTSGQTRPRRVLGDININIPKNNGNNNENLRSDRRQMKLIERKPANIAAYIPPLQKPIQIPVQPTVKVEKPIQVPVQPIVKVEKPIQVPVQPIVKVEKPIQVPVQPIVKVEKPIRVPVQPIVPTKKPIQVPVQPIVHAKKTETFVASLGFDVPAENCHPVAFAFRSNYIKKKEELAKYLLKYFNEEIFGGKLPDTITIEWEPKFLRKGGVCHYKYVFDEKTRVYLKSARIRLSTKFLDTAYKLQSTLIHEMCHAAVWILDNVCLSLKDCHGPPWQKWTNLAMGRFPELPPITQYHYYKMKTKFTYKCLACGHCIGRHSKSLDIKTKRCDRCNGQLELLLNRTTRSGRLRSPIPIKEKPLTGFALYVKENFREVSKDRGVVKPTEVMKLLAEQFSNLQTGK